MDRNNLTPPDTTPKPQLPEEEIQHDDIHGHDDGDDDTASQPKRNKRSVWLRIAKWVSITILSLLLLTIAITGIAVWILTPERLTPLVNHYANEYLKADFRAGRVELTFWSTFPQLTLQVDSVTVVSHSLGSLPDNLRKNLGAEADTLLTLHRLRGSIDLAALYIGRFNLYDVELNHPRLNIVVADSLVNNYDIFPPSAPDEADKPLIIPSFSINRFAITGGFPMRYRSLSDSVDVSADIISGQLEGHNAPVYTLTINGNGGPIDGLFSMPALTFGLNGAIHWSRENPGAVKIEDLTVSADKVALTFDAAVEMLDSLAINELKIIGQDIALSDLINIIPPSYRGELAKIKTNLHATLKAELLQPYVPSTGRLPRVKFEVKMPRGTLAYEQLQLHGITAEVSGSVDTHNPDNSIIEVGRLEAAGRAIDLKLTARVSHPLSDPDIKGTFEGSVDFTRLPSSLTSRLPMSLRGVLKGNADYNMRASDLTPDRFHRIKINGRLSLSDFNAVMNDGSGRLYMRRADFSLGTSNTVTIDGNRIDSLLTADLTIDTVSAGIPGINLGASGIRMGVGSRNIRGSSDTTRINPMGASISIHRLNMQSDSDSVSLRMTDAKVKATLQRYQGNSRSPLLKMYFDMKRMRMNDRYNRLSMRNVSADITLHPRSRKPMSPRMQHAYDSLATRYPSLSSDSLRTLARKSLVRNRRPGTEDNAEKMDFGIDNSLRSWLQLWNLEGHLTAAKARLFTPYLPVRNRITNLNLGISTDSITLRDTRYQMGRSDFLINGSITNLRRALTSRRGTPLRIAFDISSDTINFNDITRALMSGAEFTQRIKQGQVTLNSSQSDEQIESTIARETADSSRAAVLIPSNIEANVRLNAKNMKYGDMLFQRMSTQLDVANSAIKIDRLGAFTPMGSFGMTALYSAPATDDIRFAGGMVVRRLDLRQFLDMMPEIDSILPMLSSMEGIITAECAMSTRLDSLMNIEFHTLDMALKLSGDSLVLLDNKTFRKMAKYLLFKNKNRNLIDSMKVEMLIRDSRLMLYPFLVNMDRYRFGISGGNDMNLNLDYHIAVLKSPIPFKFGINLRGTPDRLRIRLGGAHFNEKQVASSRQLTDTVRINLIKEIRDMFRFGVRNSRHKRLTALEPKPTPAEFRAGDTISAADSLFFIRQGIIDKPKGWIDPDSIKARQQLEKQKAKKKPWWKFW